MVTLAATSVLLVLLVLSTLPAGLSAPVRMASSGPITASVAFNGVNVDSHDSLGSAISTSFSGAFSTAFTWTASGSAPVTVTQAEIQLLFFGAAVGTSSGSFVKLGSNAYTLSSDFTQNNYLYEGVYEIQATLSDNGTTLFTQDFFVWVQATNHLTIVNVLLILIILLEIYEIAALSRIKTPKKPTGAAPTPSPSTTPPPGTPRDGTPPTGGA